MNLLQLLLETLTSNSSVDSVSKKTGANSKKISALLMVAVPVLISYLTKNASSKSGAKSLAGALAQHTNTSAASKQIEEVDLDDGAKIIRHILGDDQTKVVKNLAKETGMSNDQVNTTLNTIAPYLLSSLSTAASTVSKQTAKKETVKKSDNGVDLSDGIDLSDLVGLLGGGSSQSGKSSSPLGGLGNILGSLLSTNTAKPAKSTKKQQSSSGLDLNSVLGPLGGISNTPQTESSVDGSDLLGILTSLIK